VADETKTYTQEEVDAMIAEQVAEQLDAKIAERMDKEVGGLKRNQAKALDQAKVAHERATKAEAKLAELEQERRAQEGGITSEKLLAIKKDVRTDLEREFAPILKERDTFKTENRQLKLDHVVKSKMAANGVRSERIDALFKLTADEFELTEDGQPIVREHEGVAIDKYVKETLQAGYPEFFTGTGSEGGGATKANARGNGAVRVIPAGQAWSKTDIEDIAKGKAVTAVE
jgi:hypothetical protein